MHFCTFVTWSFAPLQLQLVWRQDCLIRLDLLPFQWYNTKEGQRLTDYTEVDVATVWKNELCFDFLSFRVSADVVVWVVTSMLQNSAVAICAVTVSINTCGCMTMLLAVSKATDTAGILEPLDCCIHNPDSNAQWKKDGWMDTLEARLLY